MDDQAERVARQATRAAWRRLGQPRWSSEDWEDGQQEARLAVWQYRDRDERNQFLRARSAVLNYYTRQIAAHNPLSTMPLRVESVGATIEDNTAALPGQVVARLVNLFLAARSQRRGRAVQAAVRDVRIVDLLVQGYNNDGVALELGMSVDHVKRARAFIKTTLRTEAERTQERTWTASRLPVAA